MKSMLCHFQKPHVKCVIFRCTSLSALDSCSNQCMLILIQIAASLEKNLLPRLSSSPPDIEALRLYLTLPECPLLSNPSNFTTLTIPFAKAIISLKDTPIKVLGTSHPLQEEICCLGFVMALVKHWTIFLLSKFGNQMHFYWSIYIKKNGSATFIFECFTKESFWLSDWIISAAFSNKWSISAKLWLIWMNSI